VESNLQLQRLDHHEIPDEVHASIVSYIPLSFPSHCSSLRSAYPVLQDAAARCLAYAHLPYPKIWSDYLHAMLKPSPLHFYRVTYIAVERMKVLVEMPPEEKPAVPYAGFDSRDVKDFNMENMEEFDLSNGEGTAAKGVYEMIGATDVATTIAVWLLLLFEIYRSPSRLIGDDFRRRRIALLGMSLDTARGGAVVTTTGEGLSGEEDQQKCSMENFLEMVSDLLCLSSKFKESSYLLCLKVVAAINWQVPAKDLVGSTEVSFPPLPFPPSVALSTSAHSSSVVCSLSVSLSRSQRSVHSSSSMKQIPQL
jgi:hypothetical protein